MLGENDVISLAELACAEPGCPPLETVIAIHRANGGRIERRLHCAISDITYAETAALAEAPA